MSATYPVPRTAPRVPWGRVAAVHFPAALLAMVVIFVAADGKIEGIGLLLIGVLPVTLGGALPPYLGAVIAWYVVTSRERGRTREVVAVIVGALVGSVLPALLLTSLAVPLVWGILLVAAVAVCSAAGFAIWVLWAWRTPSATGDPDPSLN